MQILVLGMHRSGTSAVTRIINMMGAYFGPEGISLGHGPANPKGFWERKDVVYCNEYLLRHFGCQWNHIQGWNNKKLDTVEFALTQNIRSILLEMDAHRPWVMKDPRLCVTLPCWLPFLEVPIAVIASRHPLSVARSLELRNQIPIAHGLALWEQYALHILNNSVDIPKAFIRFEDLLNDPLTSIKTLHAALENAGAYGLRIPSEREISAFLDTELQRAYPEDVNNELTPRQKHIDAMLRGVEPFVPTTQS